MPAKKQHRAHSLSFTGYAARPNVGAYVTMTLTDDELRGQDWQLGDYVAVRAFHRLVKAMMQADLIDSDDLHKLADKYDSSDVDSD